LKIGKTGAAFVIDRSGQIISSSSDEPLSVGSDDAPQLVYATQSSNQLIRGTANFLQQRFGDFNQIHTSQQLDFKLDGHRQFIQVLPYRDGRGLDWLIVVAVPESDFMAQIDANNRSTIYLCCLALIVAVLIGILTARWVTKPILELNTAAKELASGEWTRPVKVQRADEVGELARSFNNMAVQLHESFEILETKNEALRLAEENYRGIFENALEGIFQSSPEGRFLRVNRALAILFGYTSPEELLEMVQEIAQQLYVDANKRDEFKRLLAEDGEIRDFEFEAYRRDRSRIWVSIWARTVKDVQGNVLYYEGNCIDITQRKQEEEFLKRQLQELQFEIDHSQRAQQVAAISETDYFRRLLAEADDLRYLDNS
jgi:PAS domain S-box-containing protein